MDKEKSARKKSTEKFDAALELPEPPPDPRAIVANDMPEAFRRIAGFQRRQAEFLHTLSATVRTENGRPDGAGNCSSGAGDSDGTGFAAECNEYIQPLLARTGPSISAALVTEGAIDQLDKLHGILEQLLDMQAQNYRLRRATRDVETLVALKQSQRRVSGRAQVAAPTSSPIQ